MKKFYAGKSYMGTNYTYDSECWSAYVFDNKTERDEWVKNNEWDQNTSQYVAEAITRKAAYQIAGINSKYKIPVVEEEKRLSYKY
jgi:hypothetical protein